LKAAVLVAIETWSSNSNSLTGRIDSTGNRSSNNAAKALRADDSMSR